MFADTMITVLIVMLNNTKLALKNDELIRIKILDKLLIGGLNMVTRAAMKITALVIIHIN